MSGIFWAVVLYYIGKHFWKKRKAGSSAPDPSIAKILRSVKQQAATKPPSPPPTAKQSPAAPAVVTTKAHPSTQIKKKPEKQFEQL